MGPAAAPLPASCFCRNRAGHGLAANAAGAPTAATLSAAAGAALPVAGAGFSFYRPTVFAPRLTMFATQQPSYRGAGCRLGHAAFAWAPDMAAPACQRHTIAGQN
eukprot:351732-Chlamydomonas_euryale.AAC.16